MRLRTQALHLAGAAAFALAQPLFDVLARNPEFFVAHRTTPSELVLLAIALVALVPLGWLAIAGLVSLVSRRAATAIVAIGMGSFAGLFALQALKSAGGAGVAVTFTSAAAVAIAIAFVYARARVARSFATLLALAALVFPVLFLTRPALRSILSPSRVRAASVRPARPAPIVFIVFDQFPVASIVGADGRIEERAYPSLAALAADGTWYRNATTVNPVTGWASPAIATGVRPEPRQLPVAADHPNSLFTLLGRTYGMHVFEPITDLCPTSICAGARAPLPIRLASMLSDLAVVYLHIVLPAPMTAGLPSVTQDWKDFAASRNWQRRWAVRRDLKRDEIWDEFVAGIRREERPVLHYAHMLLPHDPFVYLPTGERYTTGHTMPGLSPQYRWAVEPWAATQGYQRHLLQVALVDRLVGRLVARLKTEGLYDESLIVITADHGAGFRPGGPLRNVDAENFAAIMCVPLIIKRPFQRGSGPSDRNVESIDIVPTIAAVLGVDPPWRMDGAPVEAPPRPRKVMSYNRVRVTREFPASMFDDVLALARRKEALFGTADGPFRDPVDAPAREWVGRSERDVTIAPDLLPSVTAGVDEPWRFADVRAASGFVPARIAGSATWKGHPQRLALAVVVNGTIRATTWTLPKRGDTASWSAMVRADAFKPGVNAVAVFVVDERRGRARLVGEAGPRPDDTNLSARSATAWGIVQEGLYKEEGEGDGSFRWTNGRARLVVPIDAARPPSAIEIAILMVPPNGASLRVVANGCTVLESRVPNGPWSATAKLDRCSISGTTLTIDVLSNGFTPGPRDRRTLGVAVHALRLRSAP